MFCANIANVALESSAFEAPRTLVVGLGNPILGDDGIGWRIAEALQRCLLVENLDHPGLDVACYALGGLSLMEQLVGYEAAIIIDAIQSEGGIPGQIYDLCLDDLPALNDGHMTAAHDTSLQTALEVGRAMGAHLPQTIYIVGVEASKVYEFSETLSPAVEAAIPEALRLIRSRIEELWREPVLVGSPHA
jgi:hydrogenase maturation protease